MVGCFLHGWTSFCITWVVHVSQKARLHKGWKYQYFSSHTDYEITTAFFCHVFCFVLFIIYHCMCVCEDYCHTKQTLTTHFNCMSFIFFRSVGSIFSSLYLTIFMGWQRKWTVVSKVTWSGLKIVLGMNVFWSLPPPLPCC